MLIAFFDSQGMVHKEFVPEGRTVNADFYVEVLQHLCKRIQHVRPKMWEDRTFFLLHDNAPAHTATRTVQFLAQKGITVLSHPPYSPDLSPPDYFLFPRLKFAMKGARYDLVEDIHNAVTRELKAIPLSAFSEAMNRLQTRSKRCVQLQGDYFE